MSEQKRLKKLTQNQLKKLESIYYQFVGRNRMYPILSDVIMKESQQIEFIKELIN